MNFDYIIIQAGGKGTRLLPLTLNKPKGIVPVRNLPMIFHLFKKYKDKHFIIICDYLHEVLEKYLSTFADVDYKCVVAKTKGTCAGIQESISLLPENAPFMITWSDLIFTDEFDEKEVLGNSIGISVNFECRWSFVNNEFIEEKSSINGVAGVFFFENKNVISDVPLEGEFVRYLSHKNDVFFKPVKLNGVEEVGTILAFEKMNSNITCRPFNQISFNDGKVFKRGITQQGIQLGLYESDWYRFYMINGNNKYVPKVYSYDPLCLELVDGKNPYELQDNYVDKKRIICSIVEGLRYFHSLASSSKDEKSILSCYYEKTFNRLEKIKNLVPFANHKQILINGSLFVSPYYLKNKVLSIIKNHFLDSGRFVFIHGDPTFSNVVVKNSLDVVFIDPRGYFGESKLFGDPYYDFAKLYYSIDGNYDQFNKKKFSLFINKTSVDYSITSSGYEQYVDYFFELLSDYEPRKIRFLHALIWLSLTTYAWEDYDSICGAFYNGTVLLNKVLKEF